MGRPLNLLILFVALGMGLFAAVLARGWVASHSTAAAAAEPTSTIVVATVAMPFGTRLTADNVTQIPWPKRALPEGAFVSVASMLKDGPRLALSAFVRNEPVVADRVTEPNQPASLSTQISQGKRAVTVAVDEVRGVAGFVSPGDFVDVVLTQNRAEGAYSEVILQRVKVLAIDQLAERREDKPVIARAVTFELATADSLKLVLATSVGRLSLILRQSTEAAAQPDRRITESDLFGGDKAPTLQTATPASAPVPTEPTTHLVTVFRDMKGQDYTVNKVLR